LRLYSTNAAINFYCDTAPGGCFTKLIFNCCSHHCSALLGGRGAYCPMIYHSITTWYTTHVGLSVPLPRLMCGSGFSSGSLCIMATVHLQFDLNRQRAQQMYNVPRCTGNPHGTCYLILCTCEADCCSGELLFESRKATRLLERVKGPLQSRLLSIRRAPE